MTPMPNPPTTDDELRAQVRREVVKAQYGTISELTDAIMSLIHQDRAALLQRVDIEVIGADENPNVRITSAITDATGKHPKEKQITETWFDTEIHERNQCRSRQRTALATIKKDVGGTNR